MPSSSLLLGVGAVLSTLTYTAFAAKYQIQDSYTGANWLEAFKFETYELNNGFVDYVDEATATSKKLYKTIGDDVLFGVDSSEKLNSADGGDKGRKSVRLEGKKNYNHGLFVIDVKAMPSICGMWPAFWSLGQEPWPAKGEIDIIEGVNQNAVNKYVLHTDTQCKTNGLGQTGNQLLKDCAFDSASGASGCDVNDARTNSFGAGFNANGGGIYAMEWDSDAIKTWFFPRGSTIPASLRKGNAPDTSEFGTPAANFEGDCDIDKRFKDHRFIFTNNFCGDWAGNVYSQSTCPQYKDANGVALSSMSSCKKYVAENPKDFENAFWRISSFKTYQKKSVSSSSSVAPSSTRASSSSIRSASSTPVRSSSTSSSSVSRSPSSSSSVRSPNIIASSSSVRSSSIIASSSSIRSSSILASSTPAQSSSIYASSTSIRPSSLVASSTPGPSSSVQASSSLARSSSVLISSSTLASSSVRVSSSASPVSSSIYASGSVLASSSVVPSSSVYVSSSVYASSSVSPSSVSPASSSVYVSKSVSISSSVVQSSSVYVSSSSASDSVSVSLSSGTSVAHPSSSAMESPVVRPSTASSGVVYPASSYVPHYPIGTNSTAVYSGTGYLPSSTSVYDDSYPSYGSPAQSTPCTTSSAKVGYETASYSASPKSSTLAYPVYSDSKSSAPVYGDHPAHPSKSAHDDYDYLPSFSLVSPIHPDVTSKPSSDNGYNSHPEGSKTTITTTYTTTYVDVCETGYTTVTTKHVVTYLPSITPAPYTTPSSGYPVNPPPGFEVTTKVCKTGCGKGPTTVTVTVPCSKCGGKDYPTEETSKLTSPVPAITTSALTQTTKVYQTKIITLSKVPVPENEYYAQHPSSAVYGEDKPSNPSQPTYGGDKPSKPVETPAGEKAIKPVQPSAGYPASNATISYGTGYVKPSATKTGYGAPEFTGAASGLQASGLVAAVVALAAFML